MTNTKPIHYQFELIITESEFNYLIAGIQQVESRYMDRYVSALIHHEDEEAETISKCMKNIRNLYCYLIKKYQNTQRDIQE